MKRAEFSSDRLYRYTLWRTDLQADRELFVAAFNPGRDRQFVQFIGLNPSTADEVKDDPTLKKCAGFARRWGFGSICMTNLFAFRATDPSVMKAQSDPVGPHNDHWLKTVASKATMIVCAWGNHGGHMQRDVEVMHELLRDHKLHCLKLNDDGSPQHPLYISNLTEPIEYRRQRENIAIPETDNAPLAKTTTHKLEIEPETAQNRQWRCKCGYTLGDGREKFLAPCPLANFTEKQVDTPV